MELTKGEVRVVVRRSGTGARRMAGFGVFSLSFLFGIGVGGGEWGEEDVVVGRKVEERSLGWLKVVLELRTMK